MAQDEGINVKIPTYVTIRDVITFVSIAVSISLAWGVFGTRLTLIEKEQIYQDKTQAQMQTQLSSLTERLNSLELRIRDTENFKEYEAKKNGR